jgi:hypothetical protein
LCGAIALSAKFVGAGSIAGKFAVPEIHFLAEEASVGGYFANAINDDIVIEADDMPAPTPPVILYFCLHPIVVVDALSAPQ